MRRAFSILSFRTASPVLMLSPTTSTIISSRQLTHAFHVRCLRVRSENFWNTSTMFVSLAVSNCGPQTDFSYEPATVPISYHKNIFDHSHQSQCQENPRYFHLYYHWFRESVGTIIVCHYRNRTCVCQNCVLRYHCHLKFNLKARYSRTLSATVSTLHQLRWGNIIHSVIAFSFVWPHSASWISVTVLQKTKCVCGRLGQTTCQYGSLFRS